MPEKDPGLRSALLHLLGILIDNADVELGELNLRKLKARCDELLKTSKLAGSEKDTDEVSSSCFSSLEERARNKLLDEVIELLTSKSGIFTTRIALKIVTQFMGGQEKLTNALKKYEKATQAYLGDGFSKKDTGEKVEYFKGMRSKIFSASELNNLWNLQQAMVELASAHAEASVHNA